MFEGGVLNKLLYFSNVLDDCIWSVYWIAVFSVVLEGIVLNKLLYWCLNRQMETTSSGFSKNSEMIFWDTAYTVSTAYSTL